MQNQTPTQKFNSARER